MTGAVPVTVHQQKPQKANVNEPLICTVYLEKKSGTINGEDDHNFTF